jgi:glycosyltransferase domain-containing protein
MSNNKYLDKVTIIIPSYYLHSYLKRTLEFYKDSDVKIIVVDSTDVIFKERNKYKIQYYHLPGMTYSKKLYFASQKITTDYTFICSHDDIVLLDSLEKNVRFLDSNSDYVASQGSTLFFNNKYRSFNVLALHDYSKKFPVNSSISNERISQQFQSGSNFMHQVYSVARIKVFKNVFKYCSQYDIKDIAISELIQSGIYSISGKLNNFSSIYYCQENLEGSAGSLYPTYLETKGNKYDHKKTRLILSDCLYKNSNLSEEESMKYVDDVLNGFLDDFKDSFFMKIKKIIRKNSPDILFKYRFLKNTRVYEEKVYQGLSKRDKKRFDKIKYFFEKYEI